MTDTEAFRDSLLNFENFPANLVYHDTYNHVLEAHAERLALQNDRLFFGEDKTNVELWEYQDPSSGFVSHLTKSYDELQSHIVGSQCHTDPQSRFVFIHAAHSRERLNITREMLAIVLTYHQTMASFVDFLFSFGKQDYPRDFHFSGLYHESHFTDDRPSLSLPQLGRSGKSFQMCYNLKSVEPSNAQPLFPWSMRLLAVYHNFDILTGKAFWTIVKADGLIKERIKAVTTASNNVNQDLSSPSQSFSLALAIQLIIFDWSREKVRWYISSLEERQDNTTRRALTTSFDKPSVRTSAAPPNEPAQVRQGTLKRTMTFLKHRVGSATGTLSRPHHPSFPQPTPLPREFEPNLESTEIFSISDLQKMVDYEEKITELLLVIRSNINIVTGIKLFYIEITSSPDFPDEIKSGSRSKIEEFEKAVTSIVSDLEMQYSRADMLLSTLANRKGLLNRILDCRNMEANKRFAEKAEASTREMQTMTEEMNSLAQKTKQETVSMRIITLVTLFFLPGTFISTIMSTDILQYSKIDGTNKYEEDYSSEALIRYVTITLPLMALTFAAWYVVYLWVDKKQNVNALKKRMKWRQSANQV